MSVSLNQAWLSKLEEVFNSKSIVNPRGQKTKEILNTNLTFSMEYPVLSVLERNLGYKFLIAEAWWILTGKNDVVSIEKYSPIIKNFSDDGIFFQGAYGPKIINQLSFIIDSLKNDLETRQAVMTIWEPNPRASKDHTCTVSVQWLVRDGKLHCFDKMRSSDIYTGVPYDMFNFTMLSVYIILLMRDVHGIRLELGDMHYNATSCHLYERNFEDVERILKQPDEFSYEKLIPHAFINCNAFLYYLEIAKDHRHSGLWLDEIIGRKNERKQTWY